MSRETSGAPVLPTTPTADPNWLVVEEGFNLAREHEIESLFAVANGYVGTRGSLAEGCSLSAPATFVAGVFDIPSGAHPAPELVVAPDWLRLRAAVDGQELRLENGELLEHRRILDLRQGILWREWRQRDPTGRITSIRGLRLASLADRLMTIGQRELEVNARERHGELRKTTDLSLAALDALRQSVSSRAARAS